MASKVVIGALVLSLSIPISVFAYTSAQTTTIGHPYTDPNYVGYTSDGENLGYVDPNYYDITGTSFEAHFEPNPSGSPPQGTYRMVRDTLQIIGPFGSQMPTGSVIGYGWTSQDYANGYRMAAWDDLSGSDGYIQAINGNYAWETTHVLNTLETVARPYSRFSPYPSLNLVNFADVVLYSGAIFINADGNLTCNSTSCVNSVQVQTSPVPHASITAVNVSKGTVPLTLTAGIASYHETHHREALEITGPNGYDKWVNLTRYYASSAYGSIGSSSIYDDMAVVADGDRGGYDGAPPKLVNYTNKINLPIDDLSNGVYTAHYYVDDWFGRPADDNGVTATFTVGPQMTLAANPTQNPLGGTSVLSVTVPNALAGSTVEIDGTVLSPNGAINNITPPTTTFSSWSGSGTETQTWKQIYDQNAEIEYVAKLFQGGQLINESNTVDVTWGDPMSVTLSAYPTQLPVGSSTNLEAVATNVPQGDTVILKNLTHPDLQYPGFTATAFTNSKTIQQQDSRSTPETDDYIAEITNENNNVLATSSKVSVTWSANGGFNTQLNLVLQARGIPQSVAQGSEYKQKFEVSNDSNSSVNTVLQFSYSGMEASYVQPPRGCPYWVNTPVTYTNYYPVSLAPKGHTDLTVSIQAGESYTSVGSGSGCAAWEKDPTYSFNWTANVNPNHIPAELTYADNILQMTIPTTGQNAPQPVPYVISNPPGMTMFGEKYFYNPNWQFYNGEWHYTGPGPSDWTSGKAPFQLH